MFEESLIGPPPLSTTVKVILAIWFIILVPWFPFFTLMGTGMAFEGGYTVGAFLFVASAWAYPLLVAVVYVLRRRRPGLVWLPVLALLAAFLAR